MTLKSKRDENSAETAHGMPNITSDQLSQPTETSYAAQGGADTREHDQNTVASAVRKAGILERLHVDQLLADGSRCHGPNAFAHAEQ